jgi:Icc-related predicted phosphoesterase
MQTASDVVRLAALSDLHYSKTSQGSAQSLFAEISEKADVLLLCGDLTDYGLAEEAKILAKDLAAVTIPVITVLGNHDFEAGEDAEIVRILSDIGVKTLDGDVWEFRSVGFAGVRGFCGGFGRGALGPWGEKIIKDFVHEAVQEALKLESALARLTTHNRVVLMHYAPIRGTVEGEPLEIFPFLGSSRLEEPLTRFDVTAVFHGHAHKGAPEGHTTTGIPVFNVAHAVLKANYPDRPPFRIFDVYTAKESESSTPGGERRTYGRRRTDQAPAEVSAVSASAGGDGASATTSKRGNDSM